MRFKTRLIKKSIKYVWDALRAPCTEHGVCQFTGSEDKARQSMQSWDWCVLLSQCDTLPWIIQPRSQAATGRTHQYSRICSVVFQRRTRSAMALAINLAALQWPSNSWNGTSLLGQFLHQPCLEMELTVMKQMEVTVCASKASSVKHLPYNVTVMNNQWRSPQTNVS